MLARGGQVYQVSCSKCHGPGGAGGSGLVLHGDTVRGPSLVAADWELSGREAAIRQVIFTGTAHDMPHWGLEGLELPDIQAVAAYVDRELRRPTG